MCWLFFLIFSLYSFSFPLRFTHSTNASSIKTKRQRNELENKLNCISFFSCILITSYSVRLLIHFKKLAVAGGLVIVHPGAWNKSIPKQKRFEEIVSSSLLNSRPNFVVLILFNYCLLVSSSTASLLLSVQSDFLA